MKILITLVLLMSTSLFARVNVISCISKVKNSDKAFLCEHYFHKNNDVIKTISNACEYIGAKWMHRPCPIRFAKAKCVQSKPTSRKNFTSYYYYDMDNIKDHRVSEDNCMYKNGAYSLLYR